MARSLTKTVLHSLAFRALSNGSTGILGLAPAGRPSITVFSPQDLQVSRALELLKQRLAWYGFKGMGIRGVRRLNRRWMVAELVDSSGRIICCVKIDGETAKVRSSNHNRRALAHLLRHWPGRAG